MVERGVVWRQRAIMERTAHPCQGRGEHRREGTWNDVWGAPRDGGGWPGRAGWSRGARDEARSGEPSTWQMGVVAADPALGHQHRHRNHCRGQQTPCDDPSVRCCAPMTRCDGDGSGMVPQVGRRPSRETSLNRRKSPPTAGKRLHYAPRPVRPAPARVPLGDPDTSGYSARFGVYAPPRRDIRLVRLPAELSATPDHSCVWRDTYERALSIVVRAQIQTPKADRDEKSPSNTTASRYQGSSVVSGTRPRPA